MTDTQIDEPPHRVCEICNDDIKCLNNERTLTTMMIYSVVTIGTV